jgi:hypothetical protein
MGDIADSHVDYFTGENSFDDPAKMCKYCGAFPLFWLNKKGKWVLIDQDGNEHKCKQGDRPDPFGGI